jgi:DNA polymerase-3 subunit epsilon
MAYGISLFSQLSMKNFAIIDIETTGSYYAAHSITEIAIILHDGKKVIDSFQTLVNPETPISPYVSRLTGITNDMVSSAPKFYEVARHVWNMTENAIFVAHSVNFDYSFIRQEFRELGADFKRTKLCTVRTSRKIFPGHPSYSLGNICTTLGIPVRDRHRAMGDAEATVKLLEQCIENDHDGFILKSLKKNSNEAILPPLLPAQKYHDLPEKTGVYYFHDDKGKIIYVGKAVNIKKRINSHFAGVGTAKLPFISSIADITYQVCGTELIALLLESSEIKRLFPLYNQAQKFERNNYILTDYIDQRGIHHVIFTKKHRNLQPLLHFRSFDAAREYVFRMMDEFELCGKCCGIHTGAGPCLSHMSGKCKGICNGIEEVESYNQRVQKAIAAINTRLETRLIVDEGREYDEKSVVLIDKGVYKGFGYFSSKEKITSAEEAYKFIELQKHNPDVQRILEGWEFQNA